MNNNVIHYKQKLRQWNKKVVTGDHRYNLKLKKIIQWLNVESSSIDDLVA